MSEMPSGAPMAVPGHRRRRSTAAIVGLSLLLVLVGFVAGAFTSRAFGQPAAAAVIRTRTTHPRIPGFNPGGPLRPGGRPPGSGIPGGRLPAAIANGSVAVGTITSVTGNTVTIKTLGGQTLAVQVGGSTAIRIVKSGSIADLTTGSTIVAAGTRTSSGALQARLISQGGAFSGRFGSAYPGQGSSGSGAAAPSS